MVFTRAKVTWLGSNVVGFVLSELKQRATEFCLQPKVLTLSAPAPSDRSCGDDGGARSECLLVCQELARPIVWLYFGNRSSKKVNFCSLSAHCLLLCPVWWLPEQEPKRKLSLKKEKT